MDTVDSRLPGECLTLIQELFTKDVMKDYDEEFGVGGSASSRMAGSTKSVSVAKPPR